MYRVVEVEANDEDEAAEAAETGYGEDTDADYTGPENFETWVVEVEEAND